MASEGLRFNPKHDLVKKIMRALEKIPASTEEYQLQHVIRNTVADILAKNERARWGYPVRR